MRTRSAALWALRNAAAPAYRLFLHADGAIRRRRDPHRIALASYPRSGNTWIRDLLESATGRQTGSIYPLDPVNTGRPRGRGLVIKTHEPDSCHYAKAIHLVRDPFDAITSFYNYRRDVEGYLTLTWSAHLPWATRKWRRHTEHWLNARCPTLLMRYEQLKERPAEQLRRALDWLGIDVDDATIQHAVDRCQLQQLRRRYRKDLGERADRFFRKGVTGDGRDGFTPAQIEYVENELGDLMRRLGYRLSSQTDEPRPSAAQADPPTVSIVTPALNHAKYLGESIESVLNQDWPDIELIVMDGGSTDGTVDLLKSYGDRITWFSEPDGGQSEAINSGIARSRGSIVTWLNADDLLAPGAMRTAAEYLIDHPEAGMVYGLADFINAQGRFIRRCEHIEPFDLDRLIHCGDYIVQPAAFFRREAFESVGGLDESLNWGMDWDLFIRIGRRYPIHHLRRLLAHYRWLGGSKTATGQYERLEEVRRIGARYGVRGRAAYFRLEMAHLLVRDGAKAILAGRWREGIGRLGRGAGELLTSPRAMMCLFRPHTWRVFFTARRLGRIAAAQAPTNAAAEDHADADPMRGAA